MLTTAEEDRLETVLPDTVAVEYDGQSTDYTLTPFWGAATDNPDPGYPMVVLQYDSQNTAQSQRQPLDDVTARETSNGQLVETAVAEVADVLSVTIATTTEWDGQTPATVRAHQLARAVWNTLRFDTDDLNSKGQNGERPMRVALRGGASLSPTRVEDTYRIAFTADLHHRETHEQTTETVEQFDTNTDLTQS